MIKAELIKIIDNVIEHNVSYDIEIPKQEFGDYSTNVALKLTKIVKKSPIVIAEELVRKFDSSLFEKIEVVNGFINFTISRSRYVDFFNKISFKPFISNNKKVLIEFGSVNPTGPLHIGHGRNLVAGDSIASILEYAGYKVTREYYINDNGVQISNLVRSLESRISELKTGSLDMPEDGYMGKYVVDMAKELSGDDMEAFAVSWCLDKIKKTAANLGISYDSWKSEKRLNEDNSLNRSLEELDHLTYEKDQAIWLKTTNFGDDKDRVIIKADGEPSYFASDILYSRDKVSRGYDTYLTILGADHHGYVKRYVSTFRIAGFKGSVDVLLTQLATFIKDGKQIKMSKRAGSFYTLDDLLEEIGSDACRIFFVSKKIDTALEFDIDLAKESNSNNPLYYIQYAYARICSLLDRYKGEAKLSVVSSDIEKQIIKKLSEFDEVIERSARDYDSFKLYSYLLDLASLYHSFYNSGKILGSEAMDSKIALSMKVKDALSEIFGIFKIETLERM